MTINEYQQLAGRTIPASVKCSQSQMITNAALGMCGEAGEVADIVKKWQYQGHEISKEKLAEEAGDIAWYIAMMATALDMNLEDLMRANIGKLKKRYPDGFSAEKSINREEYRKIPRHFFHCSDCKYSDSVGRFSLVQEERHRREPQRKGLR